MLMQSHLGAIDILPALPSDLAFGKIHGLRARGGFELDFSWDKGKLSSLKVKSTAGGKLLLNYKDVQVSFSTKKGEVLILNNKLQKIK